jgi:formate-dependent nitrite reductase membrane component NrfD
VNPTQPLSDTFFTASPHWTLFITLYFFVGGIAGGCAFIGALLDLSGNARVRPVARMAHYIAFIGVCLSGLLLVIDLSQPLRFWHMMIQSNTWRPMFKSWSPISFGAWGVGLFAAFAFLMALGAAYEDNVLKWRALRILLSRPLHTVLTVSSALGGLFLAAYTGILLNVTNRPIWADTKLLGMLFLISGVSAAAATLILVAEWRLKPGNAAERWLVWLHRRVLVLDLIALVLFIISLGRVARAWISVWGIVLVVGVLLIGILMPLALEWRPRRFGRHIAARPIRNAAVAVLVGGFLLRVTIMAASNAIQFYRVVSKG